MKTSRSVRISSTRISRRTSDFADLAFDGKATSIAGTLRTIAERYRGRPLAGVMLLTDGDATDAADLPGNGSGLPPIYPVVVGKTRQRRISPCRMSRSARRRSRMPP